MINLMKVVALAVAMMCALLVGATPAAAQAPVGISWIVEEGHTLSKLYEQFGVPAKPESRTVWEQTLVNGKPITNVNLIRPGDTLTLFVSLDALANVTTPDAPAAGIEESNTTVEKAGLPDTAAQPAGNIALESTKPQPETLASTQTPNANDPIVQMPEQINPETSQSFGINDGTEQSPEPATYIAYAFFALFMIAFVGSLAITANDNLTDAKTKRVVAAVRAKHRKELGLPPLSSTKAASAPKSTTFPPKVFNDYWRTKSASQAKAPSSKKPVGRKWRLKKLAWSTFSLPKFTFLKFGSKQPAETLHERATRFAEANLPLHEFDAPAQRERPTLVRSVAPHDWMTRSNVTKGRSMNAPEPLSIDEKPQPRLARDIPVLELKKADVVETKQGPDKAPESPYGVVNRTLTVKGRFLRDKTDQKITLSFRKSGFSGQNIEWFNPAEKDWEPYVPNVAGRRILRELDLYSALGLEFDIVERLNFKGEPSELLVEGKFPSSEELHKAITGSARVVELRPVG